ncbi:MAG: murein biosynthesis integral membrane protein MurJ [Candidatus Palauibacterales bacterium]|nr:murein biosynthesis integral membrane protein MurJ [Candidatus Palauibacterales bacterium]
MRPAGPTSSSAGAPRSTARSAVSVAGGIFVSRISGFARDVAIAAFFGTGVAAAAYSAALRIPNTLRNLLGEGTLSASFVPVYSAMLEEDREAAYRLARNVLGVVLGVAALLAAAGVLLAPWITRLLVPGSGWTAADTRLTTSLVRILFPMAGVMIVGAWALGVLNSHRRFFLPFVAPVAWNLSQICGLLLGSWLGWSSLVHVLAWSTLVGSGLQVGVQLPEIVRLVGRVRPRFQPSWEPLRRVMGNAGPVIASQGVFQISSLVDLVLASFVAPAGLAGIYYAQRLAYLPLSLVGTSVATASLPEMSRDTRSHALRRRLRVGFLQVLYLTLPASVAFLLFGDLMVRLLFERHAFGASSAALVTGILIAFAVGLVATSSIKLYASGFYALQDTRTPMRIAVLSMSIGIALGAGLLFVFRGRGWGPLSVTGLILGGSAGAWLNMTLLWSGLRRKLGPIFEPPVLTVVGRIVLGVLVGAGVGVGVRHLLEGRLSGTGLLGQILLLAGTLGAAGVSYAAIAGKPPRGNAGAHARPADGAS